MDWSLKVVIYIKTIVYVLPKDLVSHEDNHCNKQSNKYGILMHLKAGVQQWKFPTPEGGDFRNQVHMIVSPFNCQRGGNDNGIEGGFQTESLDNINKRS